VRTRYLQPGFFKNEELASLPFEARLLFAGLWLLADREGRLGDRPTRIRAEIFPYEDVDVVALLDKLHDRKFISRYEVDGRPYILIPTFCAHQRIHPHERKSCIPPPMSLHVITSNDMVHQGNYMSGNVTVGSAFVCVSSVDKKNTHNASRNGNGVSSDEMRRLFEEEFWARAPLKYGHQLALQQWINFVTPENVDAVLACWNRYLASDQVSRNVVSRPATWLEDAHRDNWQCDWPRAKQTEPKPAPASRIL